jgi:hypothetical protein
MSEKELRYWPVELRLETREGVPEIVGYAAVFNVLSEDLGGFREQIAAGAFSRSLEENDIRALWDHDSKYVLGRNRANTLQLAEDAHGLRVRMTPPATQWASDLMESMKRGDVSQMSFGFITRGDFWERDNLYGAVRTLTDVDLFDVSVVTYPAYSATSVAVEARDTAKALVQAGRDEEEAEGTGARARLGNKRRELEIFKLEVN